MAHKYDITYVYHFSYTHKQQYITMRRKSIYTLIILLFFAGIPMLWNSCDNTKDRKVTDNFQEMEKLFVNPPTAYRSKPLWVWNGKVTEAELERMLIELKESGFGGLFVHPRPGLITEYLSDEWFQMYNYTVERGKELGLEVWIYDENSYPSGFAGGHVPQEMPESYNQGQGLIYTKTDYPPIDADDFFICLKKEDNEWKEITDTFEEYRKEKGEYYVYTKTYYGKSDWYGGYSYVDLLVPGVTEKFIEITMSGYEKAFKEEFGKTIPGVFTDEPNIVTSGGIKWTPDLFNVFQAQWGYDLKPLLPLLSEETGEWKKVRHNYLETLLQMFIDRWSKPWNTYTNENNLKWTGHYWEHGWPQLNDGPDNMAMYAWHQIPAIDMLFNQFDEKSPQAQFGNIRAVKELRSVANQMGYKRTLSETYGGGGWDETFKDFKRLGDWEYVLGVNFMNQHLSHMTLEGARKYDYPPVFTYHSPWWSNYKELNDYFARLSLSMSKGEQQNNILVLEPTSTLWCYYTHYSPSGTNPALMKIGTNFQTFVTTLEKSQVEYDLGSENIIKDQGRVENGKFILGLASYSTVVLPPDMENLNSPTFALLKEFVAQGGKIIAFNSPDLIDGRQSKELVSFMTSPSIIKEEKLTSQIIRDQLMSEDFTIHFNGGNLFHHRKQFSDGELIFLVNSCMDTTTSGSFSMKGKTLLRMDAMTGKIMTYPVKDEMGSLKADFQIEPAGSLLLFCSYNKKKEYPEDIINKSYNTVKTNSKTVVSRTKDNVLTIDFLDLNVKGKKYANVHSSKAASLAFNAHGFQNGNPWNTSVQYKRNILDKGNFTDGGFTATYTFTINEQFDYSGMKLVVERAKLFDVKVNGKEVQVIPEEWWLDKSFSVFAIGQQIVKGENFVELNISPMNILAEIEPIYIIGDFAVIPEKTGWSISAPIKDFTLGSWKEQKQPFYSWGMKYSKSYYFNKISGNYIVELGDWNGTVAEVYVNKAKAGWIGFDPFLLDITKFVKEGQNNIDVVVIGSLKNLLGPHYHNPAPGLASPWHWRNIVNRVSGNEYQLIDYGLMEDFNLLHQTK